MLGEDRAHDRGESHHPAVGSEATEANGLAVGTGPERSTHEECYPRIERVAVRYPFVGRPVEAGATGPTQAPPDVVDYR